MGVCLGTEVGYVLAVDDDNTGEAEVDGGSEEGRGDCEADQVPSRCM
jgi:hypothetical protein